ncbi:MAG: hypothetical protein ACI8P9_003406 [Parasphingorhabdus sp.]|jgi:hypothetical protein
MLAAKQSACDVSNSKLWPCYGNYTKLISLLPQPDELNHLYNADFRISEIL